MLTNQLIQKLKLLGNRSTIYIKLDTRERIDHARGDWSLKLRGCIHFSILSPPNPHLTIDQPGQADIHLRWYAKVDKLNEFYGIVGHNQI